MKPNSNGIWVRLIRISRKEDTPICSMQESEYFGRHYSTGNSFNKNGKLSSIEMLQPLNSNTRKKKNRPLNFTTLLCIIPYLLLFSKLILLKMPSRTMGQYSMKLLKISINWASWMNRLKSKNFGKVFINLIQMYSLFKNFLHYF